MIPWGDWGQVTPWQRFFTSSFQSQSLKLCESDAFSFSKSPLSDNWPPGQPNSNQHLSSNPQINRKDLVVKTKIFYSQQCIMPGPATNVKSKCSSIGFALGGQGSSEYLLSDLILKLFCFRS